MRTIIYLTVVALCLVLSENSLAQSNEITRDEYDGPWRTALEKARTLPRRNISKTEIFQDGKVLAIDEWIYEYVPPERIRYIHIETKGGTTQRKEEVNIGKVKYCRKDSGHWEIVQGSCVGGFVSGISNSISTNYSVENSLLDKEEVKIFSEYSLFQNGVSRNNNNVILTYSENKYWLGRDGLLIREETRAGLVDGKTTDRITVGTYEYNPKDLKIEAPIK